MGVFRTHFPWGNRSHRMKAVGRFISWAPCRPILSRAKELGSKSGSKLQPYQTLVKACIAVSRVAGWSAHVLEQGSHNRLIRPQSEYIGPEPRKPVPLSER